MAGLWSSERDKRILLSPITAVCVGGLRMRGKKDGKRKGRKRDEREEGEVEGEGERSKIENHWQGKYYGHVGVVAKYQHQYWREV